LGEIEMKKILILLVIINTFLVAECLPLEKYISEFDNKSLLTINVNGFKGTFKSLKKEGKCYTIFNSKLKEIDSFPYPKSREKICPSLKGYHEISLIVKYQYNPKNHILALLVANEYSAIFANGGINPYYGFHLVIYQIKNKKLLHLKKYDKYGWGNGLLIGNQYRDTSILKCDEASIFKYKTNIEIQSYIKMIKTE
jgi:hypothetical protein